MGVGVWVSRVHSYTRAWHAWWGVCMYGRGCACMAGGVHSGGMHGGGGIMYGRGGGVQERWPLKRSVHIPLECMLVYINFVALQGMHRF